MRAVNLIPAEERRGAGGIGGRSGGIVYVLTGGLAVLVALGAIYALAVHSVADRKGQLATLSAQLAAVNAETQSLSPYVQIAAVSAAKVEEVAVASVVFPEKVLLSVSKVEEAREVGAPDMSPR